MKLMKLLGITGVQFNTVLGYDRYYFGYDQQGNDVEIVWDLTTNNIKVLGENVCSVYPLKEAIENLESVSV